MDKIVGNVYLGSIFDVKKYLESEWDEEPIAILSIGDFKNPHWKKYGKNITHVYFDKISDYNAKRFGEIIDEAIAFIDKHSKNKKVLVHCWAGVNRSASVVIAWLALSKGMSVDRAMAVVESKHQIHPFKGLLDVIRAKKS